MFTGLIADLGSVAAIAPGAEGVRLRIASRLAGELRPGDSVAVDGVCLTVTALEEGGFAAAVMNQTLGLTTLGRLEPGAGVNLELALRASERLGGHILQGHVDGIGEVLSLEPDGFARRLRVALGPQLIRYLVERGSIALAGVSLTVSALGEDWAEVSLIPETLQRTSLGALGVGDAVNVECDLIAKYVERLVSPSEATESSA